jgi:predicted GIY-YIG superfamily endonuclease
MPRRSGVAAKAGPIPSLNELRLGKPREGCRAVAAQLRRRARTASRKLHAPSAPRVAKTATFSSDFQELPAFVLAVSGHVDCLHSSVSEDKRFVYVLRNADQKPKFYIGLSSDVDARLSDHNMGRCPHTASRRPWQLHVILEFSDEKRAIRFERYLKSGSGRAFAKRHFEP